MPQDSNSPTKKWMLHKILNNKFNDEEFRSLCYYLGVDYDELEGDGLGGKTLALLLFLERREKMLELERVIKKIRPDISLVPTIKSSYTIQGRYKIIDEIGKGGMATVYLAEDLSLSRLVAIKLIDSDEESFPRRFRQEVEIISNLMHRAIVPVHDTGSYKGKTYYVMSYLIGGSLRQRLNSQGSLPLEKVISIVEIISSALEKVHQMGIVHRDIKPENILLDEDGNVYLSDFGIAVIANAPRYTAVGGLTGSLPYMAPEQINQDGEIGPHTDIYQLGVTVFELLTGELPSDLMFNTLPKATDLNPLLPEECNEVLFKATAREIKQRFPTVTEFAEALVNILSKSTIDEELGDVRSSEIYSSSPTLPCPQSASPVLSEIKDRYSNLSKFIFVTSAKSEEMVKISFAPIERRVISIKVDSQTSLKLRFDKNPEVPIDLSQKNTQTVYYRGRCWYVETQQCKEAKWLNDLHLGDIDISSYSNVIGIKIVHDKHKATLYILLFIA